MARKSYELPEKKKETLKGRQGEKKNDGVGGRRKKSWNNIFESLGSGVI